VPPCILSKSPCFSQNCREETGSLSTASTPGHSRVNRPFQVSDNTGTIVLKNERQGLSESTGGQITCAGGEEGVWVRNFRAEPATREKWPPVWPAQPRHAKLSDPEPGPTLRARVGDLVQLTFVNEINPNNFDPNIDVQGCTEVGTGAARQ
jgi:hypothetical protein